MINLSKLLSILGFTFYSCSLNNYLINVKLNTKHFILLI
nr:MAG TPA: hypothetical protein [Caudoviricetes sp.]